MTTSRQARAQRRQILLPIMLLAQAAVLAGIADLMSGGYLVAEILIGNGIIVYLGASMLVYVQTHFPGPSGNGGHNKLSKEN